MSDFLKKIIFVFQLMFLAQLTVFSQSPDDGKWIKTGSVSGAFSVDVPADYTFFRDDEGFAISRRFSDYRLSNVGILNAFTGTTLLSIETYSSEKSALDSLYEKDDRLMKADGTAKNSSLKLPDAKIKVRTFKTDEYFWTRWYFYHEGTSYILTAASRDGETPDMKRFFDSVSITKNKSAADTSAIIPFRKLKVSPLERTAATPDVKADENPAATVKPAEDKSVKPLIIFVKPLPNYTTQAREGNVSGSIKLKVTFSAQGNINDIKILTSLPNGLLRQTIFTALRMKFLPQEKDGKPISITKIVTYTFEIY